MVQTAGRKGVIVRAADVLLAAVDHVVVAHAVVALAVAAHAAAARVVDRVHRVDVVPVALAAAVHVFPLVSPALLIPGASHLAHSQQVPT